jgi:mono/diheme cytochrome c family protein
LAGAREARGFGKVMVARGAPVQTLELRRLSPRLSCTVQVMRTFVVLKGWLLFCLASTALVYAQGVVIGPTVASAPEVDPGKLLVSELNCAACHKPASDAEQIASRKSPRLGKTGLRLTPQYLRKYLNDPAASKPGTTMPDVLHHLRGAEKTDTVDALIHFLISEQESAPEPGTAAEDYLIKQGRTLYHTIGCVACHEPQSPPNTLPGIMPEDPKLVQFDAGLRVPASVPLGDLARKTTVDQLAKFLIDPVKVRPSGRMPSLNLNGGEATAIAVYLLRAQAAGLNASAKRSLISGLKYQYYEQDFSANTDFDALTPKASGSVESFDLSHRQRENNFGFRFSGNINIPKDGNYTFFTRSDDGSMLYIDGKLVVNNNGDHAPEDKRGNVQLTAGEHSIVATYYQNGAGFELSVFWRGPGFTRQPIPGSVLSHLGEPMMPLDNEEFTVNQSKADKGRQLFASLGCAACHQVGGEALVSVPAKPLRELKGDSGCLSANPGSGVPKFGFTTDQRSAIQRALEQPSVAATPEQEIVQTLGRLNCYACHTRDAKGGATDARLAYFRTAGDLDMGDEGRIPPHLTAVGAKLRPEWMHEVLVNHGRVRPYMATRMPQFGAENAGFLPGAFAKADARADERRAPEITQRDAKYGRKLTGTGGLSCISCHTVGDHKSLGIPAINFAVMSKRLKYDWFVRYLIDPPSLRPGTRMPSFWPNGEAVNKDILGGNTRAQMNALWAYLESKPETDLPPGLVQGRLELVATTEPIIYRNFIRDAGSRAIGVGYPEKVNLAFDANNVRLALIWQGAFIDAARHWNGRGEGFEPPLGNNIVKMPDGPEFAILENENAAWPSSGGKEAGFKMGGYSLDEKRRPTFFYSFKGARIEESFEPVMGEIDASFRRTLTISGASVDHLWFRAARGKINAKGDSFVLDDKIVMKFPGAKLVLRGADANHELLVQITFNGDRAQILEEIIW